MILTFSECVCFLRATSGMVNSTAGVMSNGCFCILELSSRILRYSLTSLRECLTELV